MPSMERRWDLETTDYATLSTLDRIQNYVGDELFFNLFPTNEKLVASGYSLAIW